MSSKTFFVNIIDRSGKAARIKWEDVWKSGKISFAASEIPAAATRTLATVINKLSSKVDFNNVFKDATTFSTSNLGDSAKFSATIVNLKTAGSDATNKCIPTKEKPTFVVIDDSTDACYKQGDKSMNLTVTRPTGSPPVVIDAPLIRTANTATNVTAFDPFTDTADHIWLILIEINGKAKFAWETGDGAADDDDDEETTETKKDDDMTFWLLFGGSLLLACLAIIFAVLFMYM